MAVSLIFVPISAFAKENGGNGNKGNKFNVCLKAFGHFIAPGWIKNNGTTTLSDDDCALPPGIAKKLGINNRGPGNANGTTDTTAPVMRNIVVTPGINRAVVTWQTDENSDSRVFYSTTTPVNVSSSNPLSVSSSLRVTNHRLVLRNLNPNTTYFLVASSKDRFNNTATSTQMSFTTNNSSVVTDTTAPVLSSLVATPAATTTTITWNTNEAADSAVFFSTSLPVNTSATATQVVSSDLRITTHSLTMTGLATSTTYFAVVRSRDAAGNTTFSSPLSFTTGTNADVTSPVMTNLITVVGTSSLRLTWNTNEPATSKVFYSTTTPVNISSTSTPFVEDVNLVTSHSVNVTGLSTSTLYRIVVQSKDAALNVSSGIEFPVTTSQ